MDTIEAINNRRSIRKFKTDPVDDKTLDAILEAGRNAPSWANTQCWRFIVVRDQAKRDALADALIANPELGSNPAAKGVRMAPITIVACAEKEVSGYFSGKPATDKGDWYMFDTALALQNMMLAAASLGLGTVHIGMFDEKKVRSLLEIPDNLHVVEITPLGYPEYQPKPRPRKDISEIVFYEKYGRYKKA
jgi:nitroreductase